MDDDFVVLMRFIKKSGARTAWTVAPGTEWGTNKLRAAIVRDDIKKEYDNVEVAMVNVKIPT